LEKVVVEINGIRLEGELSLRIVDHGKWKLDKTTGKSLLLVELTIPVRNMALNFPPSDTFFVDCVDKFLLCEKRNDEFTFQDPVLYPKRPPQLQFKRQILQEVLDRYRLPERFLGEFMP